MNKWIAEFDLEEGDTMPEHMDLNYMGAKIDFHCRPMWIPVSERLPEDGQRVLVTQTVSERTVVYCTTFPFEKIKGKYITAWMPLPKPYEPQERSDKE